MIHAVSRTLEAQRSPTRTVTHATRDCPDPLLWSSIASFRLTECGPHAVTPRVNLVYLRAGFEIARQKHGRMRGNPEIGGKTQVMVSGW